MKITLGKSLCKVELIASLDDTQPIFKYLFIKDMIFILSYILLYIIIIIGTNYLNLM